MLRIMVYADIIAMAADVLVGSSESWGVSEVAGVFGVRCLVLIHVACLRTKPAKSVHAKPNIYLMICTSYLTYKSHSSLF
jgi:hypothetical protein